mmetsp:Transcript_10919/g.18592  ORF Transcript_10919/g.18592 Transcript_10919/m.18592 type:complete len:204 (-) Transcript_10919:37-648(-)
MATNASTDPLVNQSACGMAPSSNCTLYGRSLSSSAMTLPTRPEAVTRTGLPIFGGLPSSGRRRAGSFNEGSAAAAGSAGAATGSAAGNASTAAAGKHSKSGAVGEPVSDSVSPCVMSKVCTVGAGLVGGDADGAGLVITGRWFLRGRAGDREEEERAAVRLAHSAILASSAAAASLMAHDLRNYLLSCCSSLALGVHGLKKLS